MKFSVEFDGEIEADSVEEADAIAATIAREAVEEVKELEELTVAVVLQKREPLTAA